MEQSIELYDNITLIFGVAAAVFLVISVILYFIFDIKGIVGKLLGLTEKKALKQMQADALAAEQATKKRVQGARALSSNTATVEKKKPESILAMLAAEQVGETDSDTTPLSYDNETTKLDEDEGTVQLAAGDETTRLQKQLTDAPAGMELETTGDTVVLHQEAETAVLSQNADEISGRQFMLVRHILLIHTDEVIA